MKYCLFLVIILLPFFAISQSDSSYSDKQETIAASKKKTLEGIASFYHNKFEGRQMANGQKYSKAKFTAACNVLPLNRWVKVTSRLNNKSVIVKITDRMSARNKRLIDLSLSAAKILEMTGYGLINVRIEVLPDYKPGKE